jgi:hypothetical protein
VTTGSFVPVAKQIEADSSSASAVEVKNTWNYAFTPPYVFMAWYSVTYRNNVTFAISMIPCVQARHSRESSSELRASIIQ